MATVSSCKLINDLTGLLGEDRVWTDDERLEPYGLDAWPVAAKWARAGHRPYQADAVVRPVDTQEVSAVLRAAAEAGVPVTARGLGSSVTGQPLPVSGGIVLDTSLLAGPLDADYDDLLVTVGAGRPGIDVERYVQAGGCTLGHSPQSLLRSSVGGWLATLATGQFSSRYGGIEDLVAGFTVVLADGTKATVGSVPRSAVGPDLRHLFLGSEGTLGIITEVTLRIFRMSQSRTLEAFRFPSVAAGVATLREISQAGLRPFLLRFYDEDESKHAMRDESFTGCAMFAGCEGVAQLAAAEHAAAAAIAAGYGGRSLGEEPVASWMDRRFDFSAVEAVLAEPGGYAETIEVAHRWSAIAALYQTLKAELGELADRVDCHFSHVYPQGTSLYLILTGRDADDERAARRLERIWDTAMRHTLRLGGVLSHHHGPGLARAGYLPAALAGSLPVLQRVKDALDPAGLLNPGKLGLASDQHIRRGKPHTPAILGSPPVTAGSLRASANSLPPAPA